LSQEQAGAGAGRLEVRTRPLTGLGDSHALLIQQDGAARSWHPLQEVSQNRLEVGGSHTSILKEEMGNSGNARIPQILEFARRGVTQRLSCGPRSAWTRPPPPW